MTLGQVQRINRDAAVIAAKAEVERRRLAKNAADDEYEAARVALSKAMAAHF